MGIQNFGPDHDLAIRITKLEDDVRALSTRDILQNASIGVNGLTVNGTGGINVTGGGSITISGTGILNVASGGLSSAGSITAATTISAGGAITAGGLLTGVGLNAGTGAITGASLNVGTGPITAGAFSASGSGSISGNLNMTGQVFIPNGFAAVSGYTIAYINVDGRLCVGASAARFKQDFQPVHADPLIAGIYAANLLHFRLIAAVETIDRKMGPLAEGELRGTASVEIGLLADQLETIGLGEFVYRDSAGDVLGIQYERLTVPLIAVVQSLDRRLRAAGL